MPPEHTAATSVGSKATQNVINVATKSALIEFVRALARRQARIDAGLLLDHANDNIPATVH